LTVERTDGIPGQARAVLEYDAAAGSLDIDGFMSEPRNGLVAHLLDLPGRPSLDVSIIGEGRAEDWRGHLEVGAGSLLSLVSEISISIGPDFRLAMRGDAVPGESLGPEVSALLGPRTAFDMELMRKADGNLWAVALRDMASAAIAARGNAEIEAGTLRTDGLIEVETLDGGRLAPMLEPAGFKSAAASLSFAGPLMQPAIRVEAAIKNPSM
jgi:translocation and assembly module TamB